MNGEIITYEPNNSLKNGYFSIFREISREIYKNRWLTYQLFRRNLLGGYKQSFLGFLWILIIPLGSVATFILLKTSGIFNFGQINVPYPIYAILGLSLWQLFAAGLNASSTALTSAGSMISKINFSKKSLIIASLGQSTIYSSIQFILVLALFILYQLTPKTTILLFPLLILPMLTLTLALGLIISLLNAISRDIANITSMFITFLMFITPIFYAKPQTGILSTITKYNPIHYLINVPREIILTGHSSEWNNYLITTLGAIILLLICLIAFHLTETRITERI